MWIEQTLRRSACWGRGERRGRGGGGRREAIRATVACEVVDEPFRTRPVVRPDDKGKGCFGRPQRKSRKAPRGIFEFFFIFFSFSGSLQVSRVVGAVSFGRRCPEATLRRWMDSGCTSTEAWEEWEGGQGGWEDGSAECRGLMTRHQRTDVSLSRRGLCIPSHSD